MTLWSVEVIHLMIVRPNLRRDGSRVVMPSGSGAEESGRSLRSVTGGLPS